VDSPDNPNEAPRARAPWLARLQAWRPPRPRSWKQGLAAAGAVAGVAVLLSAAGAWWLLATTPDAKMVAAEAQAQPSRVVSADGALLDTLGERLSQPVTLDEVSPYVVKALFATEDRRFYEHHGIDPLRTLAAVWHTAQGDMQGGSTLTQQLARNLFPKRIGNERSVGRKLREMALALKIEGAYTKDEILALYLNQVPFLYGVSGVEMAAQTYFGKSAKALDVHEAALVVAMLKGPQRYDPVRAPQRALKRRNLVIALMQKNGAIGAPEAKAASALPLGVNVTRRDIDPTPAPHYVLQLRRQLSDWAQRNGYDVARDGLTVHATLDTRLQALAEQAVQRQSDLLQQVADSEWSRAELRAGPPAGGVKNGFAHFWQRQPQLLRELARETAAWKAAKQQGADDATALKAALADPQLAALRATKTRLEAGFVAVDPRDGAVRAYVGSRDFKVDRFDHVAQARRQPGSTFKPFVYGAALAAGIPQYQTYTDEEVNVTLGDGTVWSPGDMGGPSGEQLTLREGLARSRNTVTVQVMQQVGPQRVAEYARRVGIERAPLDAVPSLALGTSPVTLLEMARAYTTFAGLGVKRDLQLIARIEDRHGAEVARFAATPERVLTADQAAELVDMLRDAVDYGTGTWLRSRFGVKGDVAGKTGTTQNNTDGWFIAMRPSLVAGAWVGFNDQRVTLRSNEWGQGGHNALLLVGDFMREAAKAKRIDTGERFPAVQRPQPPLPPDELIDAAQAVPPTDDSAREQTLENIRQKIRDALKSERPFVPPQGDIGGTFPGQAAASAPPRDVLLVDGGGNQTLVAAQRAEAPPEPPSN
jgi:penicillin-binding protein 1A